MTQDLTFTHSDCYGNITGTVFDIEKFSLHDGNGIRSVVFLKGCPLHCQWCANPESNKVEPQIGFYPEKCVFCQKCVDVCPEGEFFKENKTVDWQKCIGCLNCTDECLFEARVSYGKTMTAEEVVRLVERDIVFYRNSNGGVTISGGEVTMQSDFASAILSICKEKKIHTAIETCGYCKWDTLKKILSHVDQLLFDFKCMDPDIHKEFTGVENTLILENAVKAARQISDMVVRWPVIPGVNDTDKNANALAKFVVENMPTVKRVDLLPYHSAGKSKCERIGKEYAFKAPYELKKERVEELQKILIEAGLDAKIGG